MSHDETESETPVTTQNATKQQQSRKRSFFSVPPPVKRVFDRFPQITYAANELPLRAPKKRQEHVLHVFSTEEDAIAGKPSFNPGCLKWQAYMRFAEVPFRTIPSSNHASPTGTLPFLLPAVATSAEVQTSNPVPSNKLKRWVDGQTKLKEDRKDDGSRYDAYLALIDHRIRRAWLYQLYAEHANTRVSHRLYVERCSSNPLVQAAIAHQLRLAAESELSKSSFSGRIVEADLLREFEDAIYALSDLLGEDEWFFGQKQPGLFDAGFFAYVHLILDEDIDWAANPLSEKLSKHRNLVAHRDRVVMTYF